MEWVETSGNLSHCARFVSCRTHSPRVLVPGGLQLPQQHGRQQMPAPETNAPSAQAPPPSPSANHTNTQLSSPTSHGRQRLVQTAALLRRRGWQIAGTAHHSSWVNAPSQRVGGEGELHPFLRQRALPDTVPNQTPRGCKCRRQSIYAASLTRIGYLTSAGPTTPAQFTSTCTLPTAIWIRCARPMHAREFSGRPHQHASVPAAGITASIYQRRSPHSPARSRERRRPTPGRSA
jgi:hypothetical protein